MKKLVTLTVVIMFCLALGFTLSGNKANAQVSINKIRKQCSTAAKARKYMKKITFKTWEYNGKKKVTKVKSIYVHRAIATKMKKSLDEIYKSDEKFPINVIGGFEWRGSTKSLHSLGLAVDINPNENYMIDGKKVLCGSFWKPGTNPLSIKKNGSVMKCMKKNGFKQCIWGSRRDYMHFSVKGY